MYKLLAFALFVFAALFGVLIGRNSADLPVPIESKAASNSEDRSLIEMLKHEKVRRIVTWGQKDESFIGIVRDSDTPVFADSILKSSQSFTIYDDAGRSVYELRDFQVEEVSFTRLKPNEFQVILTTNGGGTDNFLVPLKYADGKFVEMNPSLNIQIRGGWWTMPQYRTGMKTPYFKPAQLIAIEQIGGADNDPSASVFRFSNGEFRKVGKISMMKLGDWIERQLKNKKSD